MASPKTTSDESLRSATPSRIQATFCATLLDEWVRAGCTDVVVAPGSRSTPFTLAVAADSRIRAHVVLDERSAGFVALGLGLATGRPAPLVTTSGTAAAELHPAVAEAHYAHLPLLVCSADRPPELQEVGAAQTIDQTRLYGTAVRMHLDPGVPSAEMADTWRSLAARAWLAATGTDPGPVHLNLPFREPLVAEPLALPPGRAGGQPWHSRLAASAAPEPAVAAGLAAAWSGRRGVLVAGAGVDDPAALHMLANTLGWPILADHRSGCRSGGGAALAHADALLRSPQLAERLRPEVVVRFGAPLASKVVGQWLADVAAMTAVAEGALAGADQVVVDATGVFADPDRRAGLYVAASPGATAEAVSAALRAAGALGGGQPLARRWLDEWRQADEAAAGALDELLDAALAVGSGPAGEAAVARWLLAEARPGDVVVTSSSMPVRDVEWYGGPAPGVRLVANRGANGIDGVTSTAYGVALSGAPTWLLIGDLALLHDANGLLGALDDTVDLRIVVVDNGGGGIFSFLPQAAALASERFERFFATPQPLRPADLLRAYGIAAEEVDDAQGARQAIARLAGAGQGVQALVVRTDRSANVADHDRLNRAMAAAAVAAVASAGAGS